MRFSSGAGITLNCISPGTSDVWYKHGVDISGFIVSNRPVWYHVVAHHGFKVSLIVMANHSMGFMRNFGCGDLFISEPFKKPPDGFCKGQILGFVGVNVW